MYAMQVLKVQGLMTNKIMLLRYINLKLGWVIPVTIAFPCTISI